MDGRTDGWKYVRLSRLAKAGATKMLLRKTISYQLYEISQFPWQPVIKRLIKRVAIVKCLYLRL